jgi:hypothetical protein
MFNNNFIKIGIFLIIIIGFLEFSNFTFHTIEGKTNRYETDNEKIIDYAREANIRQSQLDSSLICCNNSSYAPTVKCVKQLDQSTCIIPNSDGTCSGAKYTNGQDPELSSLKTGNKLEACKIPLTNGTYLLNEDVKETTTGSLSTHSSSNLSPIPVSSLQPLTVNKTKKKNISVGDKVTFNYNKNKYTGYVVQLLGSDEYEIEYTDQGQANIVIIKKKDLVSWESGKINFNNLLYSQTYSPNSYADFSRDTTKCCFDAPQKILNNADELTTTSDESNKKKKKKKKKGSDDDDEDKKDPDGVATHQLKPPQKYQCPIGWDLVTNVCTNTCAPCDTVDAPVSVTYPSVSTDLTSIQDAYVFTGIDTTTDDKIYSHTFLKAPFLL